MYFEKVVSVSHESLRVIHDEFYRIRLKIKVEFFLNLFSQNASTIERIKVWVKHKNYDNYFQKFSLTLVPHSFGNVFPYFLITVIIINQFVRAERLFFKYVCSTLQ